MTDAKAKEPKNKLRRQVLDSGSYTTIPNWVLEDLLRVAGRDFIPYEVPHLFLYLARHTIGWVQNDGTFYHSLEEIQEETGIGKEAISRAAHSFDAVGLLSYTPADSRSIKSQFKLMPHGLPTPPQWAAAINGLAAGYRVLRESGYISHQKLRLVIREHQYAWRLKTAKDDEKSKLQYDYVASRGLL